MSKEKSDDLIDKYLAAESTLEEEKKLFNSEQTGLEAWSNYVKQKKKKAPTDLNAKIMASIQTRKRRKQRFLFGVSAAAASLVLFMVLFMSNKSNHEMNYAEKEAKLNEALSMFPDDDPVKSERDIIYEDEIIVIYTASE
ncbi:MAG: hypothetical protein AAFN93_03450 [Bacteroidota bacterium]